jgi:O-antigen/teichoic acid export membrane protein
MLNEALASILILQHSSFQKKNKKKDYSSWRIAKFFSKAFCWLAVITVAFFALYYALASPPMHWVYEVAPPAGPSSVYIPGKFDD